MTAAHPPSLAVGPLRAGSWRAGYGGLGVAVMAVAGVRLAWCAGTGRHAAAVLADRCPLVSSFGDIAAVDWAVVPHPAAAALRLPASLAAVPGVPPGTGSGMRAVSCHRCRHRDAGKVAPAGRPVCLLTGVHTGSAT